MLEKSLTSPADSVSYDLEDAVAPKAKPEARRLVTELMDSERRPKGEVMARINAVGTPWAEDDLDAVVSGECTRDMSVSVHECIPATCNCLRSRSVELYRC
jgi:citrate lyase subunit beta-like protein